MKKIKSIIVLCLLVLGLFSINNKNDIQVNHYSAQTSLLPTSILMSDEDPGSLN